MSALEPEPDPGPLPDYVVDPEAPPRERAEPKPAPRPAPILGIEPEEVVEPDPKPLIAGLGLAPPDIQSLVKESGQDARRIGLRARLEGAAPSTRTRVQPQERAESGRRRTPATSRKL